MTNEELGETCLMVSTTLPYEPLAVLIGRHFGGDWAYCARLIRAARAGEPLSPVDTSRLRAYHADLLGRSGRETS